MGHDFLTRALSLPSTIQVRMAAPSEPLRS